MTPSFLAPRDSTLDNPSEYLRWVTSAGSRHAEFEGTFAQIWAVVGLAALARRERPEHLTLNLNASTRAGQFAHAVGLVDAIDGRPPTTLGELNRTVRISRVREFREIERRASEISKLLTADSKHDDTQKTIYYVLVELLRNVVQHSADPLGGVTAAQRMAAGPYRERPTIQVAVADNGIGIFEALKGSHPDLADPQTALEKSIQPHISGTFMEGMTGSQQNAGMGLFFIAEMAKKSAGRLLIASRGASLLLTGGEDGEHHQLEFVTPKDTGYPGTLVAFDLPMDGVQDYPGLIEVINDLARQRVPRRLTTGWLRFEAAPAGAHQLLVTRIAEDTSAANEFGATEFLPRLNKREVVALDFRNLEICTQSFLHALLFEPLRIAWALRVPIYVLNAKPAVVSGLQTLEQYALSG